MSFKIKLTLGELFHSVTRGYHKICYEKWLIVCEVHASTLHSLLHVSWRDAAHCSELHSSICYKIQRLPKVPNFILLMYHLDGNAGEQQQQFPVAFLLRRKLLAS